MFSYGMNTNLTQMRLRCPQARSLGQAVLPHYQFEFKSYATVSPVFGKNTEGVLWEITPECEAALDLLEGYPEFYTKINVWAEYNDTLVPCMTYLMHPSELYNYPSDSYVDMLLEGYTAHGVNTGQIDQALMAVDYEFGLTYEHTSVTI